jgi:hypothetical protein
MKEFRVIRPLVGPKPWLNHEFGGLVGGLPGCPGTAFPILGQKCRPKRSCAQYHIRLHETNLKEI